MFANHLLLISDPVSQELVQQLKCFSGPWKEGVNVDHSGGNRILELDLSLSHPPGVLQTLSNLGTAFSVAFKN
jgi:hypothetical protein